MLSSTRLEKLRTSMNLQTKVKIIRYLEASQAMRGLHARIAAKYGIRRSTLSSIWQKKQSITNSAGMYHGNRLNTRQSKHPRSHSERGICRAAHSSSVLLTRYRCSSELRRFRTSIDGNETNECRCVMLLYTNECELLEYYGGIHLSCLTTRHAV